MSRNKLKGEHCLSPSIRQVGEIISAIVDSDPPLSVTHLVPADRVCSSHFTFWVMSSQAVSLLNCLYILIVQEVSAQQGLFNLIDFVKSGTFISPISTLYIENGYKPVIRNTFGLPTFLCRNMN